MTVLEFMYVPMPLDLNGNGPADERNQVRIEHQVWDAVTWETLCVAKDEKTARYIVELSRTPTTPPDGEGR